MPWKSVERRKQYRREVYAKQIANGEHRDWGKMLAVCPFCERERLLSKNRSGITKLPKDSADRIIQRCRSCSRKLPNAKWHNKALIIEENCRKRQQQKVRAVKYLGSKCIECNYCYDSTNAYVFDFHHRDPSQKDFLPTSKLFSWEKCRAELDKCDLLCAICHRGKHSSKY